MEDTEKQSNGTKNKKIKGATVCFFNSITFRSKKELSVYKYLLSIGITPQYECTKFTIWDSPKMSVPYYDKYGEIFQRITRKPIAVHYTPDFIFDYKGIKVILEVKGFKNDVANYKIRLFRQYLEEHSKEGEKLCYAVVYSIKNVKTLLNELNIQEDENSDRKN